MDILGLHVATGAMFAPRLWSPVVCGLVSLLFEHGHKTLFGAAFGTKGVHALVPGIRKVCRYVGRIHGLWRDTRRLFFVTVGCGGHGGNNTCIFCRAMVGFWDGGFYRVFCDPMIFWRSLPMMAKSERSALASAS